MTFKPKLTIEERVQQLEDLVNEIIADNMERDDDQEAIQDEMYKELEHDITELRNTIQNIRTAPSILDTQHVIDTPSLENIQEQTKRLSFRLITTDDSLLDKPATICSENEDVIEPRDFTIPTKRQHAASRKETSIVVYDEQLDPEAQTRWWLIKEDMTAAEIQDVIERADVSNLTTMKGILSGLCGVEVLNLSKWVTLKVTDMSCAFSGCIDLCQLFIKRWDTSKVINMSCMFEDCRRLKTLDLNNWNTSNTTNMCGMFRNCHALGTLFIDTWKTSKVATMRSMFSGCVALKKLQIHGWSQRKLCDLTNMFAGTKTNNIIPRWANMSTTKPMTLVMNHPKNKTNDDNDNSDIE